MDGISHDQVVPQLAAHLRPIFESSPDGVYVWLDETHWTCNERFAGLLGYLVDELENRPHFLQLFVHEDDQQMFASNYGNRVDALTFPVTFRFRALHRDGSVLQAETDMIPLTFGGHTIAYHFVRVCR